MDHRTDQSHRRLAVATCTEAADTDADEDAPLLLAALDDAGIDTTLAVWDDDSVDWAAFDLVVIRSTWDYALRRDEFVQWAQRVESVTSLRNPASVIGWNTDKRYLADLAADGVAVTRTEFLLPDDIIDAAGAADRIRSAIDPGSQFVVKPTVSAGSKDTVRYAAVDDDLSAFDAAASQAAALLAAGRAVMVQPYLSAVDDEGETGLVFLGGDFSHAFRKGPLLSVGGEPVTELFMQESISPRVATDAQLAVAERAIASARARTGADLLYARVDLLPDGDGNPVVLELELTEPSFFLDTSDGAPERAAAAIASAIPALSRG